MGRSHSLYVHVSHDVFHDVVYIDSSRGYCSIVETDVAIICSSMPAFASFSRAHLANSKYLSSLRSRIASRFGSSGSKSKLLSKSVSLPRFNLKRSADTPSNSFTRLRDGDDVELNPLTHTYKATVPSVQTEIHAAPHRDLEEGVVIKSLSVEHSTH